MNFNKEDFVRFLEENAKEIVNDQTIDAEMIRCQTCPVARWIEARTGKKSAVIRFTWRHLDSWHYLDLPAWVANVVRVADELEDGCHETGAQFLARLRAMDYL